MKKASRKHIHSNSCAVSTDVDGFIPLIKSAGLRATKGHIAVLDILAHAAEPLSIDEVHARIPGIDPVTAYRILKRFAQKGLVYQTDFREGRAYFEFQGGHHHHHIVCTSCGTREHVDACIEDALYAKVRKEASSFASVESHMLEFFGICKECS